MMYTITLTEDEVKDAIAQYLKVKKEDIMFCGSTGIFNFGKFIVEIYKKENK